MGGERAAQLLKSKKKSWKIPARVPRGYEMPIAVIDGTAEPEKGKFRRLGMDVVVNATWLAMFWALESEDAEAEAVEEARLRLHVVQRRRGQRLQLLGRRGRQVLRVRPPVRGGGRRGCHADG